MALSKEDIVQLPIKLFRLLSNAHPNENILVSPLNISAALHLLYSARRNSAGQTEMTPSSNQENKHVRSESKSSSESPTGCSASEACHTGLIMQDSCGVEDTLVGSNGECFMIPETPKIDVQESEDRQAPKGLHKPVVEIHEACAANKRPLVSASLPNSETDARQMDSKLGHVFTLNNDEGVASNFLHGTKDMSKHEAMNVQSDKVTSSEAEALGHLSHNPENQKRTFVQGNLTAEDIKPPSFSSVNMTAKNACDASFQPSESTVKQAVCRDPKAKLGNSSLVSIPASEVEKRESATEDHCVEATAGNNSQSSAEDSVLGLLRTHNDEVLLKKEKPSLKGTIHQNPPISTKASQEGLSKIEYLAVSGACSSLPVSLTEAAAGNVQKAPVHELSCNMDSIKRKGGGTESAIFSPLVSLSSENNDGQICLNSIQIQEDPSLRVRSNKDIASDSLPRSEDFQSREEKEVVSQEGLSPEGKVLNSQITTTDAQKESFLNHTDAPNTPSSSVVDEAARIALNDIAPTDEFRCTMGQKKGAKSPGNGVTHVALLSNDDLMDRQLQSSWDYKVKHWLNQSVFELAYSSYDLPWNKYLIGREQREALIQSRCILQQNVFQMQNVLLESWRYNRHPWMHNVSFAPRLIMQPYSSLLRSNSH